jgi:hypothetical protein
LKQLICILVILTSGVVSASGLQSSFTGSRLPDARHSTIFQYDGTVDANGNLIDVGGENLLSNSEDASATWTVQRASVIVNQYRNVIDGNKTMDVIHEDNTPANTHRIYRSDSATVGHTYTISLYMKPLNRTWTQIVVYDGTNYHGAYFNLSASGFVGTLYAAGDIVNIQKITTENYRVNVVVTITAGATTTTYVQTAAGDGAATYNGLDQDSLAIFGWQMVDNTDGYIVGPGLYHATTATTKPRLDLAPTGNPPGIDSHLQDSAGNKLRARSFDGATQCYSRAHHDCMNIFDSSHTLTFVLSRSSAVVDTQDLLFRHGNYDADGIYVSDFHRTLPPTAYYGRAGSGAPVYPPVIALNDGRYRILQIVRSGNTATAYIDGTAGASVNVAGYGIDISDTIWLGAYVFGNNLWNGAILYARLDSEALDARALAQDRERIRGVLSGPVLVNPAQIFTRSTVAKKSFSTGGIRDEAINVPRVADGVLIEGQRSNYCQQSETPAAWAPIRASVTNTTSTTLPNGTASGFHVLHEDATAANTHYINAGNIVAAPPGIFTFSADVKAINRQWVALYMYDTAPTNMYATFNVSTGVVGADSGGIISKKMEPIGNGWWRCSFTATMAGNDISYLLIVAEGSGDFTFNGLDQDSLFVTNMQGENNSFATSYCGPTLASYLTCTADNLTMDPHSASTNQIVLPELFGPSRPQATKLTIEFDAKCEWINNNTSSPRFIEISGNSGTAGGARNNLEIHIDAANNFTAVLYSDDTTFHVAIRACAFDFSQWHKYKLFIDFSDLSRMSAAIDNSSVGMGYVNNVGTTTFDTTNTLIRIGQLYNGNINQFCKFENLRILPMEF